MLHMCGMWCDAGKSKQSVHTALTMLNLGSVHLKQARYRDAHALYAKAYVVLVKISGPEHVDTARALIGLGTSNEKLGDHEEGCARLRRGLALLTSALGISHLEVCDAELNLGSVLLQQASAASPAQNDGAFCMSASMYIELNMNNLEDLQESEIFKDELVQDVGVALDMDAAHLKVTNVFPERRLVEIRVDRGGNESATPAQAVKSLVLQSSDKSSKLFLGKWGKKVVAVTGQDEACDRLYEALCLFQHVIKVRSDKCGADDLDVANALRCIGNIYMISGQGRKAVGEYWKALRVFEITLGKDDKDTMSTYASIESALQQDLMLATKRKEHTAKKVHEATVALAQARSKARQAIKEACVEVDAEAAAYLQTATHTLQEAQRWQDPTPFSYTPLAKPMLRTRRFKVSGNDWGPEMRGKSGTLQDVAHDQSQVAYKLDNDDQERHVSGLEFAKNAFYLLPEGLEAGRKLVLTDLVAHKKYNGLHGWIVEAHKTDAHRLIVASAIDNLELEVKYVNCQFHLAAGYQQGLRVTLVNLSAANAIYNGGLATIVRAFEQDPGRILVRIDNGARMCAVKPSNVQLVLPKGFSIDCRVETHSLQKASLNGKFGSVQGPDEDDATASRAIIYMEPAGQQTVGSYKSLAYRNLRFALPGGLVKGREVVYRGVVASVGGADLLDSSLIVIVLPEKDASDPTGKRMTSIEQAVPLNELVMQLPENFKVMMSVQLKDLKSAAFNDRHGFIKMASPYVPDRAVVELEDGQQVEVRYSNLIVIG